MKFTTKANQVLEVNPVCQESINAAKSQAPGEGLGPAIAADLINKIASGEIANMSQMPDEYRKLGESCGLPSAQGNAPLQPPFLAFVDELPFIKNEAAPNAPVRPQFFDSDDATLLNHQVVIGRTRDGMSFLSNMFNAARNGKSSLANKYHQELFIAGLNALASAARVGGIVGAKADKSFLPGKKLQHQPRPKPYYRQFNSSKF